MSERPDGTWDFSIVELVDRIPPRIGPGRDRDPIYHPLGREAFAAIIKHLEATEAHLKDSRRAAQPVAELLNACRSHGSIFDTRLGEPDKYGDKLLVWVEDLDFPGEERQCGPRWFAPELHAAVLLTTAPGGSIRHNYKTRKKNADGDFTERDKRRSHLSFGRGVEGNSHVLRDLPAYVISTRPEVAQEREDTDHRAAADQHQHFDDSDRYFVSHLLEVCNYDPNTLVCLKVFLLIEIQTHHATPRLHHERPV
jgi:hypothetical protein